MLEGATHQDVKRLLELFPIANIRAVWSDLKGSKEEICFAIAEQNQIAQVVNFVDEHLSCCKQHVYVFTKPANLHVLPTIDDGELVSAAGDRALYVLPAQYRVVLKEPLEETTLHFLWPVRIEIIEGHIVVRFVVLEKNLASYFERQYYVGSRSLEEKDIVLKLRTAHDLSPTDLHKGVKALWAEEFMDAARTKFKKPISTASEAMDEERGIREHNPELYETLSESVLFNTVFIVSPQQESSVSMFSVDPSAGYVAFLRYSERAGDSDVVLRQILLKNQ